MYSRHFKPVFSSSLTVSWRFISSFAAALFISSDNVSLIATVGVGDSAAGGVRSSSGGSSAKSSVSVEISIFTASAIFCRCFFRGVSRRASNAKRKRRSCPLFAPSRLVCTLFAPKWIRAFG